MLNRGVAWPRTHRESPGTRPRTAIHRKHPAYCETYPYDLHLNEADSTGGGCLTPVILSFSTRPVGVAHGVSMRLAFVVLPVPSCLRLCANRLSSRRADVHVRVFVRLAVDAQFLVIASRTRDPNPSHAHLCKRWHRGMPPVQKSLGPAARRIWFRTVPICAKSLRRNVRAGE